LSAIFLIFTSFSKNMHGASTGAMFLSVCHASLKVVKTYFWSPAPHFGALVQEWCTFWKRLLKCCLARRKRVFQKYARRLNRSHDSEPPAIASGTLLDPFWSSCWGAVHILEERLKTMLG